MLGWVCVHVITQIRLLQYRGEYQSAFIYSWATTLCNINGSSYAGLSQPVLKVRKYSKIVEKLTCKVTPVKW